MRLAAALLALGLGLTSASGDEPKSTVDWPSFRGPGASGVATGQATPVKWNVESGENLRWKTAIPGLGHSSPVIWGDRIFVTSAISGKADPLLKVGLYGEIAPVDDDTVHRFTVHCLDKRSGELLWTRTAHEGVPKIKRHTKASHANSTPATDGRRVVAFFGSEGLYAYDFEGKLLWKRDLGLLDSGFFRVPAAQWGFGSSPVIHGDRVIVQVDVQQGSFLAALDLATGQDVWRVTRDEVPTWSTPAILERGATTQIVVNGFKHIGGYDFATGKEIWKLAGGGDIPVPTPVVAGELVYITNAHGPGSPIYAIEAGARGTLDPATGEHFAWSVDSGGAYMQTPLVTGGVLYVCRDNGVLSAYDATSGERLFQERLGGGSSGFTASAVSAGGKLYYTSEYGTVYVLEAGRALKLLAENELGEVAMATPAISDGVLYFRTQGHLLAIGAAAARQPDEPRQADDGSPSGRKAEESVRPSGR